MSLTDLWQSSPGQLSDKHIQQVIAFAGNGKLKDGNNTSDEFRTFIELIPAPSLARYASECLESRFDDSGFALQDVVNQAGKRLGFQVKDGRYRGTTNHIGYDGLWVSPWGDQIVVEVKTTDAYRIDLDTIADYRRALIRTNEIAEERSSILIIVGRQDTGDLEAQIRGSQHAWDIRLLSVDSLFRLVSIHEEIEGPAIAHKICDILIPREYTRVDGIIDLVFATTAEARADVPADEINELETVESQAAEGKKPKFTPVSFHEECIVRIQDNLNLSLVRRSKATFISPNKGTALICTVSREHSTSMGTGYWFAFHTHQRDYLETFAEAFVAFGCGSSASILLIPYRDFKQWLNGMNMTHKEDREYWHVQILKDGKKFILLQKANIKRVDLTKYCI
jgi:hypothetical protein